jgi:hypothetical protein
MLWGDSLLMGSNQGKQPHHADRGGKVWSRDEKRENRKTMRSNRNEDAITDSVESNLTKTPEEVGYEMEQSWLDEGWEYFQPVDMDTRLKRARNRRRRLRKFCQGKDGLEHTFDLVRTFGPWFGMSQLQEFRCTRCGKTKTKWKDD